MRIPCLILALGLAGLASLAGPAAPAQDLDPVQVSSWPGYFRGAAGVVAVSGKDAYVGAGTLLVVDASDPHSPRVARTYPGLAHVSDLVLSASRACVQDEVAGLQVLDLKDPAPVPIRISGYGPNQSRPDAIALTGDLLLAAIPDSGLHLLDLQDPRQPRRIGVLPMQYPFRVAVSHDLAYVIERRPRAPRDFGRLHIVTFQDPANPRSLGFLDVAGVPIHLAVSDGRVGLSIPEVGLRLIDVTEPANPKQVGAYTSGGTEGGAVTMDGRTGYLVGAAGLEVLDLSDPTRPRRIGLAEIDFWPANLAVSGGFLYGGNPESGLRIFDVRLPSQPRPAGGLQTRGDARAVVVSGHHAFLADGPSGLQVFDVTIPLQPRPVAHLPTLQAVTGLATLSNGSLAALEAYQNHEARGLGRLVVLDINDPQHPRRRGSLDLRGTPTGVSVSDSHACLAYWGWDERFSQDRAHLEIIDLQDLDHPRAIGQYQTPGRTAGLAVSGHHVYLAGVGENPGTELYGRIEVLDVRDPTQPRLVGVYRDRGEPSGLAISGPFAYVAGRDWDDGAGRTQNLLILDISDPTKPFRVGGYAGGFWGRQVALTDGLAYLADFTWNGFLEILDVRRPSAPVRRGALELGGFPGAMAVLGKALLLPSGNYSSPWFGSRGEGLLAIDALRSAGLRRVGRLETASKVVDVAAADRLVYAASPAIGLATVDVGQATHPRSIGVHATELAPARLTLSGDRAYLLEARSSESLESERLSILDVSEPARPRVLGQMSGRRLRGLALSGRHAYGFDDGYSVRGEVSYPWSRLDVIDVGDPNHPRLIGQFQTNQLCSALAVAEPYLYLARPPLGLEVMEVSDPARPRSIGRYETEGTIRALALAERYAYLTLDAYGIGIGIFGGRLEILDRLDPRQPRRVGYVDLAGRVSELSLHGPCAYVLAERAGLHVIDISDPAKPRRVGGNSAFQAGALAAGQVCVAAAGPHGVDLLDPFSSLRLGIPELLAGGQVRLRFTGTAGQGFQIQQSQNLTDWADWRTVTLDAETAEVTDAMPPGLRRFYRIRGSP